MSPRLIYVLKLMRRGDAWTAPYQDFHEGLMADLRVDPLAKTR